MKLTPLLLATPLILSFFVQPYRFAEHPLGNWVQAAAIGNAPRSSAACFVIGNTAYVGLGYNESLTQPGRLRDFWAFTVETGWTQVEDFPGEPRSNAAAFAIGNNGYVGIGWDGFRVFQDFYCYDPAAHQWTRKADFHDPRYDAVGFGLQGKGYIGTGYNAYSRNDFYAYDPAADTWTLAPGTSGNFSKRRGAVALVYKDKAYIVTGSNNGAMVRDMWSFDPSQAAPWHALANITNTDPATWDDDYTDIQRELGTAFINGDKAFLTTGSNGTMQTSTWSYDFAGDRWSRRTAYPRSPRTGAVSFTLGGLSFVGSGFSGSNATFDDFDQFQPNTPFNANDF